MRLWACRKKTRKAGMAQGKKRKKYIEEFGFDF
jgi:hypothetical protein